MQDHHSLISQDQRFPSSTYVNPHEPVKSLILNKKLPKHPSKKRQQDHESVLDTGGKGKNRRDTLMLILDRSMERREEEEDGREGGGRRETYEAWAQGLGF